MTPKLRVLSLTNYCFPGGTSNRILGMAHGLDRDRFEHAVVMIQEPSAQIEARYGSMLAQFERDGIVVRSLGERNSVGGDSGSPYARLVGSMQRLQRAVQKLAHLVRELKIDVIDAHNAPGNIIGVLAGRLTRTASVITLYYVGPPAPVALWPVVGRVSLDLATAVVTDSNARAKEIKTWMYRRREKVEVIPNGVPLRKSILTREAVRASFGVRDDDTTVITQVGALVAHKGPMTLLEAARIVLAQERRVHFLIVGYARSESGFDTALRNKAQELGIADHVTIRGYDGPIVDVWNASDIQAHASLFDSLPAAIIEAMSAGLPTVSTLVGGIPEIVCDGQTGFLVPPNDSQAFAGALLRLIRNKNTAKQFGAAAFRRYQEQYTPPVTASRLEQLFYRCAKWPV